MPTYRFEGYTRTGGAERGTIDAPTEQDALLRLKEKGIFVSSLDRLDETRHTWRDRISIGDVARFTRRLATLTGSAVPLLDALTILAEQEKNRGMRGVIIRVSERIREGNGIRQALAAERSVFSESYVAMVGAGESSGSLDRVLDRLATFLEDQERVRGSVSAALAYPLLMVVVGGGVMIFLLSFVIPKIVAVFAQSRAALPLVTRITIGTSRFLSRWWWLLLGGAGVGGVFFVRSLSRPAMRTLVDRTLLRLPIVGDLLSTLIISRVTRVLAMLLTGGVPLVRALEIAADVAANRVFQEDLRRVRQEVTEGKGLAASLGQSPLFPPILVQMISTGEKSGRLDEVLDASGRSLANEFDLSLKKGMALLEPMMVLVMGLFVGFIVVSVLLPIFEMNQLIR
ncbi:MAG: type II secretion system inner membrane protein GspF [Desulfuromonadia bacterium]